MSLGVSVAERSPAHRWACRWPESRQGEGRVAVPFAFFRSWVHGAPRCSDLLTSTLVFPGLGRSLVLESLSFLEGRLEHAERKGSGVAFPLFVFSFFYLAACHTVLSRWRAVASLLTPSSAMVTWRFWTSGTMTFRTRGWRSCAGSWKARVVCCRHLGESVLFLSFFLVTFSSGNTLNLQKRCKRGTKNCH